jgi:hypothetical protein
MPSQVELLLEAERRGILPPEKQPLLNEARNRGLIPSATLEESTIGITPTQRQQVGRPLPAAPTLQQPLTAGEVATQAIQNIPGSAVEFGKSVAQPFIHPVETAKSLGAIAEGLFHKLIPGEDPSEQTVDALVDFFKERYGGIENIKQTIATDPVGLAADLSLAFSGGSVALRAVARAARLTRATRTASIAGKAGRVVGAVGRGLDPLRAAGIIISKPVKLAGKLGKQIIGNITTGRGAEAIEQAYLAGRQAPGLRRKPDFIRALKGEIDMSDVLKSSKTALNEMKGDRSIAYRSRLQNIKRATQEIDISPIRRDLAQKLDDFNVRVTGDGSLDFSRSTLTRKSVRDVQEITDMITDWGGQPGDLTAAGLDVLKRRLDDFFAETKNSRAMVTSLRNKTKQAIVQQVPEYATMTKEYSKASKVIDEVERALSLGNRKSMDTAIRKLTSVMKSDQEFRLSLVNKLDELSGIDLKAQIAGIALQPLAPQGVVAKLAGAGLIYAGIAAADPRLAVALLASSPRAVAEFVSIAGKAARLSSKVAKTAPAAFQVGRATRAVPQQAELEQTPINLRQ